MASNVPSPSESRRLGGLLNGAVANLAKLGISLWGTRLLYVRRRLHALRVKETILSALSVVGRATGLSCRRYESRG